MTTPFPYLGTAPDAIESLAHTRISCWVHCLRDALYATGLRETARALAQPVDFVIERTADGELLTLYGGLDADYHHPRFQRGLSAHWETSPDREAQALDLIHRELARGHAVPVSPDLRGMRHSEYYRIPRAGYPHTLLIHELGPHTALAADRNTRASSGFTDNRGAVPTDELRRGMAGAPVLVWDAAAPAADWADELYRLLERSVRRMTRPGMPEAGLAGLLALPGVLEDLEPHPARAQLLRLRVAGPLQRQVAGDRLLLARVLAEDTWLREQGPRATALAADCAELTRASSDALVDLARAVFLLGRSWSADALRLCGRRAHQVHALDVRAADRMSALAAYLR
ncbi:hypothetical protein AMK16_30900 [Streptomyces sp. CB00455]|uniref:hypothetical protein n=1 Tax=Streptomyces sp. CB00455 TaxID=1703927 RepID=UPI00093F01DD|nr:hypothetical protein [Streptomyces sp. CB00455]OKK14259.1 hypothetical protein AMK16_30900 [Streptomyces sp. CB00455]